MKQCTICNKPFPIKAYVDGRKRNLQRRSNCLECQPLGSKSFYKAKRKWTDEQLKEAVATSFTFSDVLRKIGLKILPGNRETVRSAIRDLNLSIEHFTGKSHGTTKPTNKRELSEMLIENSPAKRRDVKSRLLKDGIMCNECSLCGIREWRGEKIVMVLDHINGINNDHRIENLRLLCPNCNSQQPTFCRGSAGNKS